MKLCTKFQVDERFFVHQNDGYSVNGVNFVAFKDTSQRLLIVDLVKKKAPIYAGVTNQIEIDFPASVKKSNRRY